MFAAKFFKENNLKPEKGVLFVANSCEEGLGNLKGTRQIFKDFEGRIKQFVSYDSASLSRVASECVGSHRYEVTVKTEGGHSYGRFGNKNAIAELSKIITKIYEIEVPCVEGSKTTYNVGGISGGTSVNTIAQEAKMLCEYRSTHAECLAVMKAKFEEIFESAKSEKVEVLVELIGERPCSEIPEEIQNAFAQKCGKIIESINACLNEGIKVNINTLLIKNFNDDEINDFLQLINYNPINVRFIELNENKIQHKNTTNFAKK